MKGDLERDTKVRQLPCFLSGYASRENGRKGGRTHYKFSLHPCSPSIWAGQNGNKGVTRGKVSRSLPHLICQTRIRIYSVTPLLSLPPLFQTHYER